MDSNSIMRSVSRFVGLAIGPWRPPFMDLAFTFKLRDVRFPYLFVLVKISIILAIIINGLINYYLSTATMEKILIGAALIIFMSGYIDYGFSRHIESRLICSSAAIASSILFVYLMQTVAPSLDSDRPVVLIVAPAIILVVIPAFFAWAYNGKRRPGE